MTFLPTTSDPVAVLCTFLSIAFNEEAQKTSLTYMDNFRYNVSPDTKHMDRGCIECDIEKLVQKFEKSIRTRVTPSCNLSQIYQHEKPRNPC